MRNRFFFIILATLVLAGFGINFVNVYFFKNQRLNLIDKQIAEATNVLVNSDEFRNAVRAPHTIEDMLTRVLKGLRIGKVFLIREKSGNIIFQSFNANLLGVAIPIIPGWSATETKDQYIRINNIALPEFPDLIFQVGLVVDKNFLEWEIIDRRVVGYVIGIIISLFFASVLVTVVLLEPIRQLVVHLNNATAHLTNLRDVEPIPSRLASSAGSVWSQSDEFSSLINSLQKLIDRINSNYKLTRSWTFQMAHELKTPLAIIRAETESKRKMGTIPNGYANDVVTEVKNMTEIISQFLDWADLENSKLQTGLHALRLAGSVRSAVNRIDKINPGRIHLHINNDSAIFANPMHLDQLITNLLTNALKFSSEKVNVLVEGYSLKVIDRGPGISDEVMERLGAPFNVGSQEISGLTGNGLGLAWVTAVAKLYDWEFSLRTDTHGTEANVIFPTY